MNQEHNRIRHQLQDAAQVFIAIAEELEHADKSIIAATGLPSSQIRLLYLLHHQDEASIGKLAHHLDVGLPTASYHVDQLVEAGFLERTENKADRRAKVIRLTPAGQSLVNSFTKGQSEQMENWLAQLAPDDLEKLVQGLKVLAAVSGVAKD